MKIVILEYNFNVTLCVILKCLWRMYTLLLPIKLPVASADTIYNNGLYFSVGVHVLHTIKVCVLLPSPTYECASYTHSMSSTHKVTLRLNVSLPSGSGTATTYTRVSPGSQGKGQQQPLGRHGFVAMLATSRIKVTCSNLHLSN